MATWLTPDSAELAVLWPDIPMDDAVAALFLNAAKDACIAYAPATIPTPPGGVVEQVAFTVPASAATKSTTASGTLTRFVGGVAMVEIAVANPTAVSAANPLYTVTTDTAYAMDNTLEYGVEGAEQWAISWTPGTGLQVQVFGSLAAGATRSIRTAIALTESPDSEIPDSWVIAQALQARNTYNSAKAAPGGDMDGSSYGISAFPLDWQVQQLLRPRTPMGAIL